MKAPTDTLLEIERAISHERGPFTLFALFLREEALEKWDLVVSAPWIEKDRRSALKLLSDRVQASLSASDLLSISRIVLADPSDPAVDAINRTVRVGHSTVEVKDSTFSGSRFGTPIYLPRIANPWRFASGLPDTPRPRCAVSGR